MDISLGDLLTLEPRLNVGQGPATESPPLERLAAVTVSWAVTTRTTPPHLPLLRGGEVLLVPARVAVAIGEDLAALVRESHHRDVSAIVFERSAPARNRTYPQSTGIPILEWNGELTADAETTINRLLTECRGNLYRIGSELERQMADIAANVSGVEPLVQVVSQTSGLPLTVFDARGHRLAASPENARAESEASLVLDEGYFKRELPSGAMLVIGPVRSEQGVIARFLIDRIAAATGAAIQREAAARPRGLRRTEATAALLLARNGTSSDHRAAALALGLDPDAVYFVAVTDSASESEIARALAPLGFAHPAGGENGHRATLIAANGRAAPESLSGRVREIKRRWEAASGETGSSLALSAPAVGVASIPRAAREAEFVAAMQSRPDFTLRAASFASVDDVGAMGLLYELRDSPELRRFIAEALGTLETRDQRGTLRSTLRAFLESGGSQVAASQRLGIHRNTLAYRLRRIGELVGRDVADPASWLTLHLALRAADMLEVSSDEA